MLLEVLCKVLPLAQRRSTKTIWLAGKLTIAFLFIACLHSFAHVSNELPPPVDITGKITDENGEVVPYATITIKGTTRSVTSDEDGVFILKQVSDDAVLTISGVNIEPYEVKVGGRKNIAVTVSKVVKQLNEAVVVGFATQKKVNLTGAVSQVSGRELENRPVANIGQALQGLVPNLNMTTGGDPGGPGTNATFNIRGSTNIPTNNTAPQAGPLFIVDGMPVDQPNDLNPQDIESISVLKDAAASSIYGARAPYGVILITTKKGKKGQKATINYSNMFGQSTYTRLPDMADSYNFAIAMNTAAVNSGQSAPFSDEVLTKLKANVEKPGSYPVTGADPSDPNRYLYASDQNLDNVDWFREYFKRASFNQKHDLSIAGGGENTTYYLGAGFYDQGGQLKYGDEKFLRYNLTGNIQAEPTKWLRVSLKTRFVRRHIDIPFEYGGVVGNWAHQASTRWPNWALRNPDGYFSHSSNLMFMSDKDGPRSKTYEDDLTLISGFEIEPIKDWKINAEYSYNNQVTKNQALSGYVYSYAVDGTKYHVGPVPNSISEGLISDNYQSANAYTSYEKSVGSHYFKVLTGLQTEIYKGFAVSGSRADLITEETPAFGVATGTQFNSDNIPQWGTIGFFGRINYNFQEKYLLELNGRYDGTSRFPEGRRFGFFPSVSAGYVLSKENYWKRLENYINIFKVRASYGVLGNQNVENYLYLTTLPIGNNGGPLNYILNNLRPTYLNAPGSLKSPNLTWETSRTFNIGFDATVLNNKLDVSFDWFVRNTLDMLGPSAVLPSALGVAPPFENNADMQTKGFEITINWRDRVGEKFSYNVGILIGDSRSKIKEYFNPNKILPLATNRFVTSYYPGMTVGEIWGYETVGLIQKETDATAASASQQFFNGRWTLGDVIYRDQNGDGVVNNGTNTKDNPGDLKVIGNNSPRYNFGVNLGFNWNGFDFSMFWQGIAKRDFWVGRAEGGNSGSLFWGLTSGFGNNVYEANLDYWTPDNTNAYWPKPYTSSEANKNHFVQTRYLQNAAYARLKNVQLGYDISPLLKIAVFRKIRVFASAENLFLITKLHKNFDPELLTGQWGAGKTYPLLKTISLGANINF